MCLCFICCLVVVNFIWMCCLVFLVVGLVVICFGDYLVYFVCFCGLFVYLVSRGCLLVFCGYLCGLVDVVCVFIVV